MLEIPEAHTISKQIGDRIKGKTIAEVIPLKSPNKLAWYNGDPMRYPALLTGLTIDTAKPIGGMVEILAAQISIILSDGVAIRYFERDEKPAKKHQLLIKFTDESHLCFAIQMYGGIIAVPKDTFDNPYYLAAVHAPSILSDTFDMQHFQSLVASVTSKSMSIKAFLATEQRIPGLGNGSLQDILFNAGIHPKKKLSDLADSEAETLFYAIRSTLQKMIEDGGRDTEKDLFGNAGGYHTILSRKTVGTPCPRCGTEITKAQYMGGSIYFCPSCQSL